MNPAQAIGNFFQLVFIGPLTWVLLRFHDMFAAFGPTKAIGAFGLAIILLTVIIRTLLSPVYAWQIRSNRRTQAEQRMIAPQVAELRKKYKRDPQKLNTETMALYKEHGIHPLSPARGCLPLLLQWPIVIALYRSILYAKVAGNFLWIPDTTKSAMAYASNQVAQVVLHPQFLILPLIAAAITMVQTRMMMQPPNPTMTDTERQQYNMSKNMMFLSPVMILVFGVILPQALAIYWVTQSAMMVAQQYIIVGWGALGVPSWFPGYGRVTSLSFPTAPVAATPVLTQTAKKQLNVGKKNHKRKRK